MFDSAEDHEIKNACLTWILTQSLARRKMPQMKHLALNSQCKECSNSQQVAEILTGEDHKDNQKAMTSNGSKKHQNIQSKSLEGCGQPKENKNFSLRRREMRYWKRSIILSKTLHQSNTFMKDIVPHQRYLFIKLSVRLLGFSLTDNGGRKE